jgi:ATP-dependent exoDNAse (exonuclease V) beta subunit
VSSRVPTPEQAAAIDAGGRDLLVEAGAGTGKTGTMVDRYCRLVCDDGVSPDAVLAFTFTDKAAAELRERIRAALAQRAEGGEERARELLPGIGGAWVTTIHGFCRRLLAGHPVAAGIDPRFRVLDAPETARLEREAFSEALEEFLGAGEPARERTVAAFGIEGLRGAVVGVHAELRSRGAPSPRLPEPTAPDVAAALRRAADAARAALAELKPGNSTRELVERAIEVLDGPPEAPDLDSIAALRTTSRAKPMLAYREAIDAAVARVAEAGEGGEAYRHVAELLRLFGSRFEAAKQRRAGLDFEDLQLLSVRLLEQTEIGKAFRTRFDHLLVDEFQDTNRLQLRLIEALRGPGSELMTVGDELQSIYGFRHADLEVFREQRRAIQEGSAGEALALSGNFRSRPELIAAVNAIGHDLLGGSYRPLRVGALPEEPEPPGGGPYVELLLTAEGWDGDGIDLEPALDARTAPNSLAEARFLAARLAELAEAGVQRRDMVVLLRAFNKLDAHEDSLERAGLRPYVVGGRGYWSQQQVADVGALLATIANPLDDQSLFGALASPACGVGPDTLWLLRAAAGRRRPVWPAVERLAGLRETELEEPQRLEQIAEGETALLRRFGARLAALRTRASRLPLADLIDAAIVETGYDLAVLMRPSGEARFANVRKLMRLAAEFEAREGRDLRGLLDFLAARSEADVEAQAATALEGHDGVRIMTIHSAKGLEFDVVAVPDLSRSLLAGSWTPPVTIGREPEAPRVGMQLRRLGAAAINLYAFPELREEHEERDAEEELRLFHVAATRARRRLLLSGVVKPKANGEPTLRTPVIERVVAALDVDRERDSTVTVPPPEPREGLEASFEPAEVAVRVNRPSPERAAELAVKRREPDGGAELGSGPAPLLERLPPTVPHRPLSYTAIAEYEDCAYRFYMERVLALGSAARGAAVGDGTGGAEEVETVSESDQAAARGAAVHSLLEWSQANGWREPEEEMVRRHALAAGLELGDGAASAQLLGPVRGWLESDLLRERVVRDGARARAEVPILLGVAGRVLRGSIDLLVEAEGDPPLVIDYKTDRLDGSQPAERASRYAVQRDIYAIAVAEARHASEVEVAYVFLERPGEPVVSRLGPREIEQGRARLAETIATIAAGEFPVAEPAERQWKLCRGCPALGRLCAGPG